MAVRSGDVRRVCHRLLQRLALARRAIIGISFPTIPWPMTGSKYDGLPEEFESVCDDIFLLIPFCSHGCRGTCQRTEPGGHQIRQLKGDEGG